LQKALFYLKIENGFEINYEKLNYEKIKLIYYHFIFFSNINSM
jgi:hypothetical protein